MSHLSATQPLTHATSAQLAMGLAVRVRIGVHDRDHSIAPICTRRGRPEGQRSAYVFCAPETALISRTDRRVIDVTDRGFGLCWRRVI
jgi:hypothetical protein